MMLTLLDRYIVKRLLDYLFLGIVVFTLVLFFSDALLDFMKDLQHYGISWDIALTLIGLTIPRIITNVIPMSALLATLMVYSALNNYFELIAMRTLGISLMRLAMPAILIGVICSASTFILYDYVVPACNQYSRALKTYAINQQNLPMTHENFTYKQFDNNQQLKRLLYISSFEGKNLGYTTLVDLTNANTLQIIQARSGLWGRNAIHLKDASVYTVASSSGLSNTTHASSLELQHFIKPETTVTGFKPKEMSFMQLWDWIKTETAKGKTFSPGIILELWEKLTIPLSSMALVLIAIPLAMTRPRSENNMGFLAAAMLYFAFYLIRHVSAQLAETSIIPPVMGAFLPLLLIAIAATCLYIRKNRVL